MRAISLFSGAGGLDLGLEHAGFRTVAVVEWASRARETMLANADTFFPDLRPEALFHDITAEDPQEIMGAAGVQPGDVTLMHGGPPCTPFSKSGYWLAYKRAGGDPKASLLDEYVRCLSAIRPTSFVMENVYGLAYRNQNRAVLDRFIDGCDAAGYAVDRKILLAADYGVPQLRQRLICVGIRREALTAPEGWAFDWPEPTHSGRHETRRVTRPDLPGHRTVQEALEGLDPLENRFEAEEVIDGTYAEALRLVPAGGNYLFLTARRGHPSPRFEWRSRYWNFLLKLDPERPSPTIQGQPGPWVGPFHWDDRRLRVAEVKRLMTFPDEFVVLGTRREQQLQLGNAVPPALGEVVGRRLAETLAGLGVADDLVTV